MIKFYLEYLNKFGSVRIQRYTDFLLRTFSFGPIEKAYIRQLPEYYREECPRKDKFIEIMAKLNLWYTLYL